MYTQKQIETMNDQEVDQIISGMVLKDANEIFKGLDEPHGKRYSPYCSNWAYMGPLIGEAKIAVMPDSNNTWKAGNLPTAMTFGWANFIRGYDKALRAAAIVYILVMQENL